MTSQPTMSTQMNAYLTALITSSLHAFPMDSRMRQKEKHNEYTERAGEKYVPTAKPNNIQYGDDDCGAVSTPLDAFQAKNNDMSRGPHILFRYVGLFRWQWA